MQLPGHERRSSEADRPRYEPPGFRPSFQGAHYPKFALAEDEIQAIVEDEILPFFEVVDVKEVVTGACRDPYDDQFLSVAVNSGAACIVTCDKDLLDMGKYRGVRIVTPQEFLASLER
jgi:predicted nucleic acid-binding protein